MKKNANKRTLCGAYYYVGTDEDELKRASSTRTLLTLIAAMLQLVALVLPQYEYVTEHMPSYAFTYAIFIIVVYLPATVYTLVINCTRYKLQKRVPVEHAPRSGFAKRTFISSEIFIAVNALSFIIELSFVCIHYNGFTLLGMFVCLLATAAAVGARILGWLTLKDAELIPAPDEEQTEQAENGQADQTEQTD